MVVFSEYVVGCWFVVGKIIFTTVITTLIIIAIIIVIFLLRLGYGLQCKGVAKVIVSLSVALESALLECPPASCAHHVHVHESAHAPPERSL